MDRILVLAYWTWTASTAPAAWRRPHRWGRAGTGRTGPDSRVPLGTGRLALGEGEQVEDLRRQVAGSASIHLLPAKDLGFGELVERGAGGRERHIKRSLRRPRGHHWQLRKNFEQLRLCGIGARKGAQSLARAVPG